MRLAATLAPSLRARLVLLHVADMPPGLAETALIRPLPDQDPIPAGQFVREASRGELERYAAELRQGGVEVETRVELGDPVETIVQIASGLDVAMIVMGTHGRTGLARLLIGSVTEKVVRRVRRPVLTVPARNVA